MTRLAVFDCDGTLVDGQADICNTMVRAYERADIAAPDPNDIRRIVGLSLPVAIRELSPGISDPETRMIVDFYKEGYFELRQQGSLREPLYDGIAELLARLHDEGWQLAVATGKSDRGLKSVLKTHGLTDLFISLQTADRHPSKPHPAMLEAALFEAGAQASQAVMIGDTSFDIAMAKAANVEAIGVAWGYHEPDELTAQGADTIAQTVSDLSAILLEGSQ